MQRTGEQDRAASPSEARMEASEGTTPHAGPNERRLLAALSQPDTYGVGAPVEKRETHASWVFLAGDWAYKVKKRVRLPFLDYSTLERRRAACHEELRVNGELAGDIYYRVVAIVDHPGGLRLAPDGTDRAVEYALQMRRFDERSTLAATLLDGRLSVRQLDAVADRVARFHRDAPSRGGGGADATLHAWRVNLDELAQLEPRASAIARARAFGEAFTRGHRQELDRRARSGLIRDGHGDLRCEHVLLGDPVRIVDRIEFDPALRQIDVGCDLAFLLMDLELRGGEHLARSLLGAYRRAGGDPGGEELVWFFAAYWALVRAKVAEIVAAQRADARPAGSTAERERLLRLGERLCWRARGPLAIVVAGPPASGKSTLANELGRRFGLAVLSSDRTRKRLAGIGATERGGRELYTAALSTQTYRTLGSSAAAIRDGGAGVVLDATCGTASDRAELLGALGGDPGRILLAQCQVPLTCALARAAARMREPDRVSDATPEVVAMLFGAYERMPSSGTAEVVDVDGLGPLEEQVRAITAAADARLARGYVVRPQPRRVSSAGGAERQA